MVKCPVCGGHVPAAAAVEIPVGDEVARFCSLRCARSAEAGPAREAPLPPVPEPPRHVLVAVDGSGPSLRAAGLAAALARSARGRVTLLHAIDPRLLRMLPVGGALGAAERLGMRLDEIQEELREDAARELEPCRKLCEAAGVPVTLRIEVDAPAHAVAKAAAEADLVVIGSRGLGALTGAALGSLSHRVIGATDRPVLVVH